jgi:hypothetical protein
MVATFEAQCQHMESLVQRMDSLMGQFNSTVIHLNNFRQDIESQQFSESQIVNRNNLTPNTVNNTAMNPSTMGPFMYDEDMTSTIAQPDAPVEEVDQEDEDSEGNENLQRAMRNKSVDHVMTTDSYGKLR